MQNTSQKLDQFAPPLTQAGNFSSNLFIQFYKAWIQLEKSGQIFDFVNSYDLFIVYYVNRMKFSQSE